MLEIGELVTRKEAADMLRVTERTIDRWLKAGLLEGIPVGTHRIMIAVRSLNRFLSDSNKYRQRVMAS